MHPYTTVRFALAWLLVLLLSGCTNLGPRVLETGRGDYNTAYYGSGATPEAIALEHRFSNPHADPLRNSLVF